MHSPARRLLPYMLRYRGAFITGFACILVTTAITLVSPWILKYAIDDLTLGMTRLKIGVYALLLLGVAVVGGVFRFLMRRIIVGASREVEYDVRNDILQHLQRLPIGYFQAHRIGDLMSRATNDLNTVRMMIGPAIMYATSTLIIFVVAVILMLGIDVRLTLLALIPLPAVSLLVKIVGGIVHRRFEKIQEQLSDLSAVVQESFSGVRVVRAYRQETAELDRFERSNAEYVERNRQLIRIQGFYYPLMSLFLGIAALLVLWLGSRAVIEGRITLGGFVAFNAYLAMLAWPMIAFGWVTNLIQRGLASWKRILEVLDALPADASGAARPDPRRMAGELVLRNLTFAYDGRPVLDEVSVRIEPGRSVALIGPTGSGKSTLIHLLLRLHEPPPGTIFLDGIDVRDIPLDILRAAIALVPQEPFLFSDTIAANVAFGVENGGADDEAVRRASAVARLDKDVEAFPQGYGTRVGERGITLSGGQKQRVALARAVILDAPILILDDALSAVDTYTEEEILQQLRQVMRQRTSIIVSHRVSTVRQADLILVLEDGRIVERGTHEELVALDGRYAGMHRRQQLEAELVKGGRGTEHRTWNVEHGT